MKIYLASGFTNIPLVEKMASVLKMDGHIITEEWWCRPYQVEGLGEIETSDLKKVYENLSESEFYSKPETEQSYYKDFEGVKEAEAVIVVATDKPRKYNGATVELGIALGMGKPVAVHGKLETSVMFYPISRLVSYQQVREWINNLEEGKEN